MKAVLEKCEKADLEYLSGVLDSYVSFTDDARRKELIASYKTNSALRVELLALVDKQIRYYGSSDLAYLKRSIFSDGDGGVSAEELIKDVCEKLGVKIKQGGSTEAKLERLVTATVEKELFAKSPEELAAAFKKLGIGDEESELVLAHLKKNGKVAVLPILVEILGPKIALAVIETIIISIIAQIVGKEAAKVLVKELVKRNPWINVLGPIIWTLSGIWLAIDLQGPAFRKTIPICLYLGTVAMRDGVEKSHDE
jgi:uncharacterized protein YaaW (UPF0174 family)